MARLEILFSGLCAFVPRSDSETPPVDVLLVNTISPLVQKLSKSPALHYPILTFDLANLKGGVAAGETDNSPGHTKGVWYLEGEEVTFEVKVPATGDPTLSTPVKQGVMLNRSNAVQVNGGIKLPEAGKGQETLFDWVPSLETALPGEGNVSAECLSSRPSSDGPISARVKLLGGTLGSLNVARFQGAPVAAQFVPPFVSPTSAGSSTMAPAQPPAQALANRVSFQYDLPDGAQVIFRATTFAQPPKQRSITLTPASSPAGSVISIQITNLCDPSFLLTPEQARRASTDLKPAVADDDFECFYILCKGFDPEATRLLGPNDKPFKGKYTRLPVPTVVHYLLETPEEPLPPDGGGIDTVRCNTVQMNVAK